MQWVDKFGMFFFQPASNLFVPQTLSSLGCPQVLQTVASSELMEVDRQLVHVVTVRPYMDGKQDDEEIMVLLPARLIQKDKVMFANTLVVFYGISMFVKDGLDMTYYQTKTLYGKPDSDTSEEELQAANFSLLTQDQSKERFGILTLGDIGEGTLFTVMSTSPYVVGEGENLREEFGAKIVQTRTDKQEGTKTYHDVQFMSPKDKRLQNVSLMQ